MGRSPNLHLLSGGSDGGGPTFRRSGGRATESRRRRATIRRRVKPLATHRHIGQRGSATGGGHCPPPSALATGSRRRRWRRVLHARPVRARFGRRMDVRVCVLLYDGELDSVCQLVAMTNE